MTSDLLIPLIFSGVLVHLIIMALYWNEEDVDIFEAFWWPITFVKNLILGLIRVIVK